ncbi:unnamed protein product [Nezara viridula]|uniref:Uncharacterized protein n=1 Tax=Nezara viridula TaxID=85310 RepID=A0A9P0H9G0_NEZVI|nr:unnamed protein product [Nezara viridula]
MLLPPWSSLSCGRRSCDRHSGRESRAANRGHGDISTTGVWGAPPGLSPPAVGGRGLFHFALSMDIKASRKHRRKKKPHKDDPNTEKSKKDDPNTGKPKKDDPSSGKAKKNDSNKGKQKEEIEMTDVQKQKPTHSEKKK